MVEAGGKKILHFSKVLDTYEEPEDEGETGGREYKQSLRISTDKAAIMSKTDTLAKIADLVKKSWEE